MNILKIAKLAWEVEYSRNIKKADNKSIGKLLVNRLPNLGPSFVKIGQFMSTREDIFGKSLTKELSLLQDSAPPIETSYVLDKLQGLPLKTFNVDPLASASIGQVHVGTLQNGKDVAIKLRRPRIQQDITNDFSFILRVLEVLRTLSDNKRIIELDIVFKEYYNVLVEEIDFYREVANIQRFSKNFQDIPWIKVPEVYPDMSDQDVIVMEYVPSMKIDTIPSKYGTEACKNAVQKIIKCYILQITKHNLVHIDPHPGNVGVTSEGKLVFYDYGMILDVSQEKLAEQFDDFIVCLFDRDADKLAEFLVRTNIIEVLPGNMAFFKAFMKAFIMYTDSMNLEEFKNTYLKQLDSVGGMPFFISSRFIMFLRGLAILEGVLRKIYPDYNYQDILQPFVPERIMSIDYFENRATMDIKAFQQLPTSMEMTQLQIEILQLKMNEQQKQNATLTSLLSVLVGLFVVLGVV